MSIKKKRLRRGDLLTWFANGREVDSALVVESGRMDAPPRAEPLVLYEGRIVSLAVIRVDWNLMSFAGARLKICRNGNEITPW